MGSVPTVNMIPDPARLGALRGYGILDTAPESAFDEVSELARAICDCKIALISLVEDTRQWFKSHPGTTLEETPLAESVCAFAIAGEDDMLEIRDIGSSDWPGAGMVRALPEGCRFYAGAVLRDSQGHALGTICVLDPEPRNLTDLQRQALVTLARQTVAQIELRHAVSVAGALRQEVDHRVKNSLQTIASLVGLQARQATPEVAEALAAVQGRIETVSALHDHLSRLDAARPAVLSDYLSELKRLLERQTPDGVEILMSIAPVRVTSDQAAKIGVIVCEFASNSTKHAWPDGGPGRIAIDVAMVEAGLAELTIGDDGVGTGPDGGVVEVRPQNGLGLAILEVTARDLGGIPEMTASPEGMRFRTTFTVIGTD